MIGIFPSTEMTFFPNGPLKSMHPFFGGNLDAVFNLGMLYRNNGHLGYGFLFHEAFQALKPKRTIAPTSQSTKGIPKIKNPKNTPTIKPRGPNAPFERPSQRPAANPQTPAPSQKKRTQFPTPLSPSRINTSEYPNSSPAELTTSPQVPSSPTGQPRPSRTPIP